MKKEDAIKHFGSQSKLAQALGINKQAVHQWPEIVPIGRQYQIEVITNGELKAEPKQSAA